MEKDIKQTIEDIHVPMDKLDTAIVQGIKQSQVKPKRRIYPAILTFIAAVSIILGAGFVSPTIGKVLADVPLIGFFYNIEQHDEGLQIALSDENMVMLNETLESNGVALTIESIVYDGARLAFTYTQGEYEEIYPLTITVNGEVINFSESLRELEADSGFRGLIEVLPEEVLPDSFDLSIAIHQIGRTKGDWTFTTNMNKVDNNSRTITTGQRGMITGLDFEVTQFTVSDTSAILDVTFHALDELFSSEKFINVTLTNQHGIPVQVINQNGSGGNQRMTYHYVLAPLEGVTALHVNYYFIPIQEERILLKEKLENKLPQVIKQGEMGNIVITSVEELVNSEMVMTFHSTSDFAFDYGFFPNMLNLTDHSGEDLITDYPRAIGPNEYEVKFQAGSKSVYVETVKIPVMEVEEGAQVIIPVE